MLEPIEYFDFPDRVPAELTPELQAFVDAQPDAAIYTPAIINGLRDKLKEVVDALNILRGTTTPAPTQPAAPTGLAVSGRTVTFDLASGKAAADYEYQFTAQ
ncbi:hypothetical protein LJ737_20685 [Hymenobacter sp. 15J16-1T3B]|uniref:hypothetical protein n=1 Tax=Hymenobacter sp. 15J16-1T3B TaxID=2886941 RepID=UPI001D12A6E8|nr:hypothetical protein [Hymenobacter sp. 15J16-1T3B]MCC3159670.1 hypothetical protein [Hymenobacter sp. 15J16-1T3B]